MHLKQRRGTVDKPVAHGFSRRTASALERSIETTGAKYERELLDKLKEKRFDICRQKIRKKSPSYPLRLNCRERTWLAKNLDKFDAKKAVWVANKLVDDPMSIVRFRLAQSLEFLPRERAIKLAKKLFFNASGDFGAVPSEAAEKFLKKLRRPDIDEWISKHT